MLWEVEVAPRQRGGGNSGYMQYYPDNYHWSDVSRRQAGVIYSAVRRGDLEATDEAMGLMYQRYASDSSYRNSSTDSHSIAVASMFATSVSATMDNNFSAAQAALDRAFTEHFRYFDDTRFDKNKVLRS